MRWPRQVMSLLFVLLLLAGPPLLLVFVVGSPLRGWPDGQQVRAWVEQPLTEQTLTFALTIGAWLVWLLLAYTVTVRVLIRLRAGVAWLRRMPLPTPLQATATGMAGAAVFTVPANTATSAPPEPAVPVAAGTLDHPDDTTDLDPVDGVRSDDGVAVSGGWLPREVADLVAAAAALVWLRRRLAYQPRRPGALGREDVDLAPLPATAAAVQAALAEHPPTSQPPDATAAGDGSAREIPGLVCGLPPGGLGLTGPGAAAAARGLLVTALLTGRQHPAVSLVVTRSALASILGAAAETLRQRLPQLTVVPSIDEAMQALESRTYGHHRQGLEEPQQPEDPPTATARPAVVVITDEPSPSADAQRLAGPPAAGATVVMLGGWPAGVTWHADTTGHTHDPHRPGWAGPRLCVLDPVAATDLLTVIAYTEPDPPPPHLSPQPVRMSGQRIPRQASRQDPRPSTDAPGRRLELRVLGQPLLSVNGEPIIIRRTAALQALVFLAAHPAGADSHQLVDAIWPGPPRHTLTGRLYTTLSDLRGSVRGACGLTIVDHTDDRYRLNPTHLDVDLWRFHTAVQHATTAVTNATTAWQAVIDAYPGDLAAGRTWPWLDPIREATRRHVIDAHVAVAAAATDPRHALAVLQHGIRVDPYNADLHVRMMNILAALGDHDALAELHDAYTRRLAEAGLEASDDVRGTAARLCSAIVPGR